MKLGITYNLFDGEELLEYSVKSVRECAEHINIVYQTTSNWGEKASENIEDILSDLIKRKLVDKIFKYHPKKTSAGKNELKKRNIGLNICKINFCSHFLNMDCDEFYIKEQFNNAKKFIIDNDIYSSSCSFANFIKKPIWKIEQKTPMYVPFIAKINLFSLINRKKYFPVLVDPTRKLNGSKKFKYFEADELEMQHMWAVRNDLNKKFNNSSSKKFTTQEYINEIINYEFPNKIYNSNVIEVENKFNIKI